MAIYLDNNATTALHAQVLEAMLPHMGKICGNPSSLHRFGRLQRDAIEQARTQIAMLVGARSEQVVFTSGGTESNNLILRGMAGYGRYAQTGGLGTIKRIAVSRIEHPSILELARSLPFEVDYIDVDADGYITPAMFEQAIKMDTGLVSIMTANNETGVIQSLDGFIERCREQNIYFHTDASQAAGKIALNFAASGAHAMTLSAHKFYGPVGAGALIIDRSLPLEAVQLGGSQEKNLRAGTENIAAIVGFGKAAEIAIEHLEQRCAHTQQLRDLLEQGLKKIPAVTIFSEQAKRLPNTVQFGVAGFDGESLLMQLDRKAIAVSSGSACGSGKAEPSHVLQAMKVPTEIANAAIRVSFGENNTGLDVDVLLSALHNILTANTHSPVMMAASL